jgi:hypothetical protein
MNRKLIGGLAVLAAGIAAAPAQAAGNTCSFDVPTGIASITMSATGGPVQVQWDGSALAYFDDVGKHYCLSADGGTAATRNTTASVMMIGTPGKDDFIVSLQGGNYYGGAAGGTDPSQVEFNLLYDSQDIVDVLGSDSYEYLNVMGGAGTNRQASVTYGLGAKPLVKMTQDPSVVRVNGAAGDDYLAGMGSFVPGTSLHLELTGGDGKDQITGGLLAGDRLQGGNGDDTFFTNDGQPADNVTGGLGVDNATIDPSDQAFGVEKFVKPVGKP